ncbi:MULTISPECIES: LCP family protein [Anaerostipes]|uniref:LCP family protein n=1 Tax=Anaerostipes TaxID=207244 RepID=UPI000952F0B9|nr:MULTISPECIES: LCP family protein [Anaerostipes]MCI5623099.1 LCP family protein [Anaerostipes sp.]MDY2726433.1 LCP family protein [Anaerostipes faecalis]OLR58463.1 cell envelope-like function transcriptional attenuator common domain protein [Anaerostipes sp. 494a]
MRIKQFKIILSIFLIIGIAAGGILGYYDARLEASVNQEKKLTVENEGDLLSDADVINVLLVGSDHGAIKGDHGRSDSIMIGTANLKTKELKLTSLMRDMYVEIPGHGHDKLNAAYAYGGVNLLYQTIAKNFGIKIDHYCVVDFSTFEKVINKVGGVEITLEEKEAEYLNSTNYISKKKYRNVKAGKQTLNGNQALGYARIRYVVSKKYGDGDFGRTGRQRAVLQAALNKVLEQNPVTIANIALDALNDVSTDMSAKYLKSLVLKVAQMGTTEIDQLRVPLESTYKMGRAQNNMFVFFINFDANKAALEYFLFNKGTEEDWAKEYGGVSGVETFGYSGYSSSSGGSSNSDSTSYNTSQTRSTSSTQSTRSESTSTSKSTTTSRPKATTAAPTTEAPTTAAPATEAPATEAE